MKREFQIIRNFFGHSSIFISSPKIVHLFVFVRRFLFHFSRNCFWNYFHFVTSRSKKNCLNLYLRNETKKILHALNSLVVHDENVIISSLFEIHIICSIIFTLATPASQIILFFPKNYLQFHVRKSSVHFTNKSFRRSVRTVRESVQIWYNFLNDTLYNKDSSLPWYRVREK